LRELLLTDNKNVVTRVEICSIKAEKLLFERFFTHFMLQFLSNPQIEQELGKRLKNHRVDLNLSQSVIATRSGLSRRTITAIENGEGSTLTSLIAILRALNALDTLESFLPDPGPSPMALARLQESPTKYPSKPRKSPTPAAWKWGDET
jgi:transcriptional regulator with XRE-family HTH domain